MSQKSILEQALLQVQTLEEAVKQNAKGILASTMKQELNDLLREQVEEEDDTEVPVAEQPEDEVNPDEEEDVTGDEPEDDETSINDEPSDEEDEIADEPESDEEGEMEDEEFGMDDMSDEMESDDDVVDIDISIFLLIIIIIFTIIGIQYEVAPPVVDTLEFHASFPSKMFLLTIPPNVCCKLF